MPLQSAASFGAYATAVLAGRPTPAATCSQGYDRCVTALEDHSGSAFEDIPHCVTGFTPTSDSWDNGDRGLLCVAYEPDSDGDTLNTTGSIKA